MVSEIRVYQPEIALYGTDQTHSVAVHQRIERGISAGRSVVRSAGRDEHLAGDRLLPGRQMATPVNARHYNNRVLGVLPIADYGRRLLGACLGSPIEAARSAKAFCRTSSIPT